MSKTVEVWTNDPEKKMATLTISGEVLPESTSEGDSAKPAKSSDCGS
jgi:hypothetical protein